MLADAVAPEGSDGTARAFGIARHPVADAWPGAATTPRREPA